MADTARTPQEIIDTIKEKLPKWRVWFPSEHSEVEIPRCDLLALIGEIERLRSELDDLNLAASYANYD